MGLSAKLNFAFFTVIGVAVGSHAALELYFSHENAIQSAHQAVKAIGDGLTQETKAIDSRNGLLAGRLSSDPAFTTAFAAPDHAGLPAAVKGFADKNGVPGYICVFDSSGKVIFSTDAPGHPGAYVHDSDVAEQARDTARSGNIWYGPATPTATGDLSIIGIVPVRAGNKGAVAVCEPLNTPFLTGLKESARINGGGKSCDLVLFSLAEGRVTAFSSGLMSSGETFITALDHEGLRAMGKNPSVERGGRYWEVIYRFTNGHGRELAYMIAGATIPDAKQVWLTVAKEVAIALAGAVLLALAFSTLIGGRLERSMRFLVKRAKDVSQQKANLPPLDGVAKEFLELAEVIDTAVGGTRLSIKNLQGQMGRHQDELAERQKLVEEANIKVDAVNRQLTIQSRQLSEVSSQINQANMQAVLLQQKLASVLQVSTEGFFILDPYGNVIAANPTVLNWLGLHEGEVAGHHCFQFVRKPGEAADNGNDEVFSIHTGSPGDLINQFFPEGVIYNRKEAKSTEVIAHLQPVMMDEHTIQGYIMALRDKNLHSEASRLRQELVLTLQDHIRTPLTVAEHKWKGVIATSKETSNTQMSSALVDLHLSYQQLLGVVDSLLMMHTGIVPATPVIREHISLTRLLGDCLESCTDQARAHQVMLDYKTVSGLPTVAMDEGLLRDAVVQLLERMIVITAPGGRVRVETTAKNNEIRASIFSSGPALSPPEIEDMFSGFVQGKHAEETYSQRLSLYLVRNNIERLGGRIWAESDRGTYVYLVLPMQ